MLTKAFAMLRMLVTGEQEELPLLDKPLSPKPLTGDRAIHSPQYQIGMHIPHRKPACFTETDTSPRGEIVEGWPHGVKPGLRNPFHDSGRSCQNASTPELWAIALIHTPGCFSCARAKRALDIAAGQIQPEDGRSA